MIAEKYTEMSRQLRYPAIDLKRLEEIEDMAGKLNREKAREEYRNQLRAERIKHREEQSKIDEKFKIALFKEYDIENNPKREKVFSMAWEMGHAEGYSCVEYHFSELVELIK